MGRTPPLSREALIGLGADRLAELALDEAETNAAFKKLLTAALAATAGPQAVAAIVDKRLAALEKATGAIGSGRVRAFVEDLSATLKIIVGDLAKADVDGAAARLVRLLATADRTFRRSQGGSDVDIAPVFRAAAAALPALIGRLSASEAAPLADGTLRARRQLAQRHSHRLDAEDPRRRPSGRARGSRRPARRGHRRPRADRAWRRRLESAGAGRRLIELRQHIADVRGDVDAFIALEVGAAGRRSRRRGDR